MNHTAAQALLIDLVDGTLEPRREQQVREHLSGCLKCSAWLETYAALSDEPTSRSFGSPSHPDSHEIAVFALDPGELTEFDRARVARHVRGCSSCTAEVRMVAASVEQSSLEPETAPAEQLSTVPGLSRPSGIGMAAMLLLFFGVLLVTQLPRTAPADITLEGGRVDGHETISASKSINVRDTAVASGAAVTLKSQSVAFGDGFSIEDSAALVVVTDAAPQPI